MTTEEGLIGSAAAAKMLGLSRRTFNRMVVREQIKPAVRLGENTAARLFKREDVEALAKADAA